MSAVASTLRGRLRARRDAIRVVKNTIYATGDLVWSRPSARWWWLYGGCPRATQATREGNDVSLHDSLEALTLLDALAQIDVRAFIDEVDAIQVSAGRRASSSSQRRHGAAHHDVVLAVVYTTKSVNGFEPIADCMYGTKHPPSPAFVDDIAWLQKELEASGGFRVRPIPVWLRIDCCDDLTEILQQILLHATAQQLEHEADPANREVMARFEIVEVSIHSGPIHADALPLLERLQERGVHIPMLPALEGGDTSLTARHTLTQSLRRLLLSQAPAHPPTQSITRVCLRNSIPQHLIVPLLSAVQASPTVKTIELSVEQEVQEYEDRDDEEDENEQQQREVERRALTRLVRWTAYAVFSRHARHNIETVVVTDPFALNPLASVFKNVTEDERWISTSQFYLEHPHERHIDTSHALVFTTDQPLGERAITKSKRAGGMWWKVLLPGCVKAWVRAKDAVVVADVDSPPMAPLNFEFDHLSDWNRDAALDFVRLVPRVVQGIAIEGFNVQNEDFDPADELTDLTFFTQEVLRVCPHLERFKLPSQTTIDRLGIFVDAATTGNLQLRELDLDCWLDGDEADVIRFFDVLSDTKHPLTRYLEELHFQLEELKSEFEASWKHMLQQNRRLHTVLVKVSYGYETDQNGDDVVLRIGPLDLASKLAFLSVFQDPKFARRGLDASVIAPLFQYAAQHLVRKVCVKRE